ncbi:MAG: 50S ribosomal protein L21 [Patescibacteria group bacterium]
MTFAVIETGAKQYKVSEGDTIKIEKLLDKKEYAEGDKITFDKVLLLDNEKTTEIGTPYLAGKKVEAELIEIGRNPKIRIMQFKSKSNYLKRIGHRQPYFKIKISKI